MTSQPDPETSQQRVVRVFVSSTFRDMHAEREELVKRIFPQLRKLCEIRGVTWGEVDLRWGIPEEQKAEGKVLPICLAEIERCRPYFIGLLGERYGWVPVDIPHDLIEQEPWLAEHRDRSVTELEILHGVLNNPSMTGHSFFYFRDPAYIDSLPADMQKEFREGPTSEEIRRLGLDEAEWRTEERRQKLIALKEQVRSSGLPVRENYQNPQQLGQRVFQDMIEVIDQLYPEEDTPDPLKREIAEHEAFARSRARVYIGRQEYFNRLDEHVSSDGPPLVVLGESGVGKSALLANWAIRYRPLHPDELFVLHFIGANPYSANWSAMLRHIMSELSRLFGIEQEIPERPGELRQVFANWLHMAAAQGRVVLILDALSQLEDRDQAPDLVWLPPEIPANIRLILSTLPGRSLDNLKKRNWPALTVKPLIVEERKKLIPEYLAQYTKALSPAQIERITSAEQTANPLYLQALLEELRIFGAHQRLDKRIDYYLKSKTIPDLYTKILERYENDYERERPGLVRDVMTLVWPARRGLSEKELLDLLGSDGQPLPRTPWSSLYLAAEQSLVSRSGLITFFHNYFREAVAKRYLPTEKEQRSAHLRLGEYFEVQELGARKVDELPWQLTQSKSWQHLFDLLANLPFFDAIWENNEFEAKAYWAQVEDNSSFRMDDAYRPLLDDPDHHNKFIWHVAKLLSDTGRIEAALSLRKYLVEYCRKTGNPSDLQAALGNQAVILQNQGDLDGAMALHEEQERICRELGTEDGLAVSLGNQALILKIRGDLDAAMEMHREAERICRDLGDKNGLGISLGNQASILQAQGDLDGAMTLHRERERICRDLGNRNGLGIALSYQALILKARGDLNGAMELHKEQERICRELGNKAGLQASLGNQALILKARGDLDGAMELHKEQEHICRELGNKANLQASLGNRALILQAQGDLDGAMALYKEQERICRELGNKAGLQASLGHQAVILQARGDLDGAMALHKEKERTCRELGNKAGLQASLGNQALILKARGDLDGAMELHKEQERICRELGNPAGLGISLTNQAILLAKEMQRPHEAFPLVEEASRLASKHGLTGLTEQIKPVFESIQSMLH